jgi:hypothetical protein
MERFNYRIIPVRHIATKLMKSRGVIIALAALLIAGSCKRANVSKDEPSLESKPAAVKLEPKAPTSLLQFCGTVAIQVTRAPNQSKQKQRVALPPMLYDEPTLEPSERRLRALEAIDALKTQLKDSPHDAQLHHQLGLIFRDFMQNPDAALGHFCRALLEAPRIKDYFFAVLSQLMEPGVEPRLELALRPGDRTLPWRKALAEVRELSGIQSDDRAEAFWFMIRAQRMARTAKSLRRRRIAGKSINLITILEEWAGRYLDSLRITVSFIRRHRSRVSTLRQREKALRGVFSAPGPFNRWLLLAERDNARGAILTASELLAGVDVGVSAIAGGRQVYLVGQFAGGLFTSRYLAMDPQDRDFEAKIVVPPQVPNESK